MSRGTRRSRRDIAAFFVWSGMKVTGLKVQARNKARVNVHLDGKFAFGLAAIVAARLRVGQELDEAAIASLRESDGHEQAYERALRFLGPRPRSEAEVRRRLSEKGVEVTVVDAILQRLRRAGLVNDREFAAYWVENRLNFRPRSQRALRVELRQKGVSNEVLQDVLAGTDDAQAAYDLASRRAARLRGMERQEFRRKLGGFLARRGFDYETIEPVLERVWHEVAEGPPD
jgi:regulatory protein